MSLLTSHQALELCASLSFQAERLRASQGEFHVRARLCDVASRVAFLRARAMARNEETHPAFGQSFRKAVFAVA
jgi:hypothetical protein